MDRLERLGLQLPRARPPLATYEPLRVAGGQAFVSGHGPLDDEGRPRATGQFGTEVADELATALTQVTILNLLSTLLAGLGSLESILGISQLRCFVASSDGTGDVHLVVSRAATGLLSDALGSLPVAAPTTVGVQACALGLPLTIDLIARVQVEEHVVSPR